jgi:hypothetical protein
VEEQNQTVEPPVTFAQTSVANTPTSMDSAPITTSIQKQQTDLSPFYFFTGLFVLLALIFAGIGLYKLYDNSYDARVVGGDAYNYIIYATRGTAFICVGIVCAVLSVTFALFAPASQKR